MKYFFLASTGRLHLFGLAEYMKNHTYACVLKLPGCNLWRVHRISPVSVPIGKYSTTSTDDLIDVLDYCFILLQSND